MSSFPICSELKAVDGVQAEIGKSHSPKTLHEAKDPRIPFGVSDGLPSTLFWVQVCGGEEWRGYVWEKAFQLLRLCLWNKCLIVKQQMGKEYPANIDMYVYHGTGISYNRERKRSHFSVTFRYNIPAYECIDASLIVSYL